MEDCYNGIIGRITNNFINKIFIEVDGLSSHNLHVFHIYFSIKISQFNLQFDKTVFVKQKGSY